MEQFVVFGDSITQFSSSQEKGFGWSAALQDAYVRRLDVINRGYSGYNTAQALKVLPHILPSPEHNRIRLMTIFFGANDCRLPNTPGGVSQTVDLKQFEKNLKDIITHPLLQAHKPQIILFTPLPVDERLTLADDMKNKGINVVRRTAPHTAAYAEVSRRVGKELNLPVLDLWQIVMKEAGLKEGEPLPGSRDAEPNETLARLLHDGLHATPEGYQLIHRELTKLIADKLPEHVPENIPFVLPRWDDEQAWRE